MAGSVEGDIHGVTVTVQPTGQITGIITGRDVTIFGKVAGSITASRLVLARSCHLEGDIVHESLVIEQGAFFEGKSRRIASDSSPESQPE